MSTLEDREWYASQGEFEDDPPEVDEGGDRMIRVVVGIDPSLSNTGVAIIRDDGTRPVFRGLPVSHTKGASGPEYEAERIRVMAARVYRFIRDELFDPEGRRVPFDFKNQYDAWFVIEGPLPGGVGGKEDERSGVRWSLILALRPYGRIATINPTKVKSYWAGNGRADKKQMLAATRKRYPHLGMVDHDANDGFAIAHAAAEARGFPLDPAPPGTNHAALTGAVWPEPTPTERENRPHVEA